MQTSKNRTNRPRSRSGVAMIYTMVIIVTVLGISSLAVDRARVLLAKTELQTAADAASCAAAAKLDSGVSAALSAAKAAAADNTVEGTAVTLLDSDIEIGTWDEDLQTFTVLTGSARDSADAVRVTAFRETARGNAIPLSFAALLGKPTANVAARSTAASIGQASDGFDSKFQAKVVGKMSPWNAGLPDGVVWGDFKDTTPNCSPLQVTGVPISTAQPIVFRGAAGQTQYGGSTSHFIDIEGDTSWILDQQAQNGFGRTRAPAHALMGVFINDSDPRTGTTPAQKNYTTPKSRDKASYAPKLKQPFYIGDGVNNAGLYQTFKPPTGATRLYLGIMDEYGRWSDNTGELNVEVGFPQTAGVTIGARTSSLVR